MPPPPRPKFPARQQEAQGMPPASTGSCSDLATPVTPANAPPRRQTMLHALHQTALSEVHVAEKVRDGKRPQLFVVKTIRGAGAAARREVEQSSLPTWHPCVMEYGKVQLHRDQSVTIEMEFMQFGSVRHVLDEWAGRETRFITALKERGDWVDPQPAPTTASATSSGSGLQPSGSGNFTRRAPPKPVPSPYVLTFAGASAARLPTLAQRCSFARCVAASVVSALHFMGAINQQVHRDVKPGNILVRKDRLKLGDFDSVKNTGQSQVTLAGTHGYMAPEIMEAPPIETSPVNYVKCDVWSIGVVLAEIILGHNPLDHLYQALCSSFQAEVDAVRWDLIPETDGCRDFIRRCVVPTVEGRMSLGDALKHEFIAGVLAPVGPRVAADLGKREAVIDAENPTQELLGWAEASKKGDKAFQFGTQQMMRAALTERYAPVGRTVSELLSALEHRPVYQKRE